MKKSVCALLITCLMLILMACSKAESGENTLSDKAPEQTTNQERSTGTAAGPEEKDELPLVWGANVTWIWPFDIYDPILQPQDYTPEHLTSYSFYESTTFVGCEEAVAALVEAGKDPGLGVRDLHKRGITGQGVRVAIIDQNMVQGHPELGDRLTAYRDFGTEQPDDSGSMHGLSVASLLAGETVGVAPGATLYFGAAPSWKMDSQYYADALWWILKENESLPEGDKIRVVSVSAAPEDGWFTNGASWSEAVAAAQEQDILVIDCRSADPYTGFVFSSYIDPANSEDVTLSKAGYPVAPGMEEMEIYLISGKLLAPASFRAIPAELEAGQRHWRYDGIGGQSWAVPYVAGVAAMGFQIHPDMTADQCRNLLFESAWVNEDGYSFLNPVAFIDGVEALTQ